MPSSDVNIRVTGMSQYMAALQALQGKELARGMGESLSRSMRKEAVPILKAEARAGMKKPGSHRGNPGTKGRTGPLESKITVRKVRTRRGEIVAYGAGSRAWWDHFFTRGVRAHVIRAHVTAGGVRGEGGRFIPTATGGKVARRINREGAKALAFNGVFREQVNHPGHPGYDWVGRAGARIGVRLQHVLYADLQKHVSKYVASAAARAARRSR